VIPRMWRSEPGGVRATDGHTLSMRHEREKVKEEATKEFRLHERLEREFERRFILPVAADTEHLRRPSPRVCSKCAP
jgi:hypothetical protein